LTPVDTRSVECYYWRADEVPPPNAAKAKAGGKGKGKGPGRAKSEAAEPAAPAEMDMPPFLVFGRKALASLRPP
ncbi:hypothetical protein D6U55_19640, partial [Vibrio cholerae]|nr:hypothetical protein [Vibrio cholerae]